MMLASRNKYVISFRQRRQGFEASLQTDLLVKFAMYTGKSYSLKWSSMV